MSNKILRVFEKAGEEIRTLDIHVGNEGSHDSESLESKGFSVEDADLVSKYSANHTQNGPIDSDLRRLIKAWPTLSDPIRMGILALLGAAEKEDA
ncbi:MAG: hypothetical protein AAGI37_20620 [Planctomycetota bacterium]